MSAPLILGTNSIKDIGFNVDNSLRFDDGSSDYLSKTFSSSGSQQKHTFSVWVKRGNLGGSGKSLFGYKVNASNFLDVRFGSSDNLLFRNYNGGTYTWRFDTNRKFRDVSSWYHLVFAVDSTQSTESNRFKLYVNGVQETSFSTETYPSQNANMKWGNSAYAHLVGDTTGGDDFDGYMAEVVVIDNAQLDATSFGEFDEDTGIWKPIDVSGLTFGTNGFYLDFEDSSALGNDVSGNDNDFTVNNLTSIDQTTDTCTNNYATLNPILGARLSGNTQTFSNGNLTVAGSGGHEPHMSTIGFSSGKFYYEAKLDNIGNFPIIGVAEAKNVTTGGTDINTFGYGWFFNGNIVKLGTTVDTHSTYTTGDILSVAVDADNGRIYFAKNGTWENSANPATGTNPSITGVLTDQLMLGVNNYGSTWSVNYGNPPFSITSGNSDANGYGNFEYSVPSGYYALNTKNLAEYG